MIGSLVLGSLSQHLLNTYPKLHLKTTIRPSYSLVKELLQGDIEFFLCAEESMYDIHETSSEVIGQIKTGIFVRASHPLAKLEKVSSQQLSSYPTVGSIDIPAATVFQHEASFICDNYHILRETVLASDSIWFSSPQLLSDDLEQKQFKQIIVTDLSLASRTNICAIFHRDRSISSGGKVVLDYVKSFLSKPQ